MITPDLTTLAALSRCFHPENPDPDLLAPGPVGGRSVLRLTDEGRRVCDMLAELAGRALEGPDAWTRYRSIIVLAWTAFDAKDGEAVAAAAAILGDMAAGDRRRSEAA